MSSSDVEEGAEDQDDEHMYVHTYGYIHTHTQSYSDINTPMHTLASESADDYAYNSHAQIHI